MSEKCEILGWIWGFSVLKIGFLGKNRLGGIFVCAFLCRSWLNVTMAKAQENSADIENWLKLIRADGIGPVTFAKMIKHFGSAERVLGASVSELAKIDGVGFKTAERIASTREKFDAGAELELAGKLGDRARAHRARVRA